MVISLRCVSFRDRVVFERRSGLVSGSFGEGRGEWVFYYGASARRSDVRDSEKFASSRLAGSLVSRFEVRTCRKTRALTSRDRLVSEGRVWAIHGIKRSLSGCRLLEITASTEI